MKKLVEESKLETSVLKVLHDEGLTALRNIEQKLRDLIDEDFDR